MKKIAILQSNYIPWKGYFDLIASVDELIVFDDMQYTKRDWRNRNLIKTPQGLHWLTVPVKVKGKYLQKIRETEIDGKNWGKSHWKTICQNYSKAPHFNELSGVFEPIFNGTFSLLTELNQHLIRTVCEYLQIKTKITCSWDYEIVDGKTDRLVSLCKQANGDVYVSGPAAKDYIDPVKFETANIKLRWFDYSGYPEYPQLWGTFIHGVSILDLLFNCGKKTPQFMRHLEK